MLSVAVVYFYLAFDIRIARLFVLTMSVILAGTGGIFIIGGIRCHEYCCRLDDGYYGHAMSTIQWVLVMFFVMLSFIAGFYLSHVKLG